MDSWDAGEDGEYDINNQETSRNEQAQPSTSSGIDSGQGSRQMGPGPSSRRFTVRTFRGDEITFPLQEKLAMKRLYRRPTTLFRNILRQRGRVNPQHTFVSETSQRNEQSYSNRNADESPPEHTDSPTEGLLSDLPINMARNFLNELKEIGRHVLEQPEVDRAPVVLEDAEVDPTPLNNVEVEEETPHYSESIAEEDSEAASRKPEELNKNMLTLLECPVCFENMEPPICQCRRGHLLCYRCRGRLTACPVCRSGLSSVRNRAMERVAEIILYPCRHGCSREMHLRHRRSHEDSCLLRKHACPMPRCTHQPMQRHALKEHLQAHHEIRSGAKHKFSMKMNRDQHCSWAVVVFQELFHVRADLQLRTWNLTIYVTFIGPKKYASKYRYDVCIKGNSQRKMYYMRTTHSDVENFSFNVSRKDCFYICLDDATNYLRGPNGKYNINNLLTFHLSISENTSDDTSELNQPPVNDV